MSCSVEPIIVIVHGGKGELKKVLGCGEEYKSRNLTSTASGVYIGLQGPIRTQASEKMSFMSRSVAAL